MKIKLEKESYERNLKDLENELIRNTDDLKHQHNLKQRELEDEIRHLEKQIEREKT